MTTLPVPHRRPAAVTVGLAGAAALVPLSSTMIAVALTDLERDLGTSVGATALWLVTGYLVVSAAGQPLGGRVGDRLGHRRTFLAGLVLFLAMSAVAAAAPSFPVLVAARAAQAAGGCLMVPNAVALMRALMPDHRRGRGFGWFGFAMALGACVGPLVGGALVTTVGWRATFLVNLPLGAGALALALRAPAAAGSASRPTFSGAVAALARSWAFRSACATIFLHNMVLYGMLLTVPLLAERRLGLGAGGAGLLLVALTGPLLVCGPPGGVLSDRSGRRLPVIAGGALAGGGLAVGGAAGLLATLPAPPVAVVTTLLLMVGAGIGLAAASLQAAAVETAPPGGEGLASGIYSTSRYLGGIAATLLVAAVAGSSALGVALAGLLAASALAVVTSLGLPAAPVSGATPPDAPAAGPAAHPPGAPARPRGPG